MNDHAPSSEPIEFQIIDDCAGFEFDPLGYVLWAFDWGVGALEGHSGPRKWQREALQNIGDELRKGGDLGAVVQMAVASGHGPGKALAHGEPVLTPSGWVSIEHLQRGDMVVSIDGKPTEVVGVYPQGRRECFRVTLDDGCSVVVDGEHSWFTTTRSERKRGKVGRVRSTSEIAASLTFPNGPRRGLNHMIPVVEPVAGSRQSLLIDPYVLGALLGDGDARGRITGESEIFEKLQEAGAVLGVVSAKPNNKAHARSVLGIRDGLRDLDLYGCRAHEKFVPEKYLRAAKDQRVALLQGLLDTDGTVGADDNSVTFDTTSPHLARDMGELVRSLGGVLHETSRVGSYNGKKCRLVFRQSIRLPRGIEPFRLSKKAARYAPRWSEANCDRTRRRFIASIEPVGLREATCIRVAHPSHLFLTRDHIVTHNSALVAWIILWAVSTLVDTRGIVTASTDGQLKTKTWPEVSKWHRLALNGFMFKCTATAIYSSDAKHEKTWRVDATPWSKENSEAFQGLHNQGKRIIVLFDEASAISDLIWEVVEGALTDALTQIIWAAFGNPTRNTGKFRECFGKFKHRWWTRQIDTRKVEGVNLNQIKKWQDDWGEDSDFFRVRVRGEFPESGDMQFISSAIVEAARTREAVCDINDPMILGVDVARFGSAKTVLYPRKGRDARTFGIQRFRGLDTNQVALKIFELDQQHHFDGIFIDEGGVGGGVVDNCRRLGLEVIGVQFGGKADRSGTLNDVGASGEKYANKRAEMWGAMRMWLRGAAVVDEAALQDDLIGPEYGLNARDEIVLESKADMEKRGLSSPDDGDALALTHAYPVHKKRRDGGVDRGDYDPYEHA